MLEFIIIVGFLVIVMIMLGSGLGLAIAATNWLQNRKAAPVEEEPEESDDSEDWLDPDWNKF